MYTNIQTYKKNFFLRSPVTCIVYILTDFWPKMLKCVRTLYSVWA